MKHRHHDDFYNQDIMEDDDFYDEEDYLSIYRNEDHWLNHIEDEWPEEDFDVT